MERTKKFDIVIWLKKLSIDLKSKLIINKFLPLVLDYAHHVGASAKLQGLSVNFFAHRQIGFFWNANHFFILVGWTMLRAKHREMDGCVVVFFVEMI